MIDILLKGKTIIVIFSPLFINEGFRQQWNNHLHSNGEMKFVVDNEALGYNGCLKLQSFNKKEIIYYWELPEQRDEDCQCVKYPRVGNGGCSYCNNKKKLRRINFDELDPFLNTINDLFYYEFDGRFPEPILLTEQSFDLCSSPNAEIGHIYPNLLNFLKTCKESVLRKTNSYVSKEMERINKYIWGKYSTLDIRIERNHFIFDLLSDGIWLEMERNERKDLRCFSLHWKSQNSMDYFVLLSGIIALNTFFRKHEENKKKQD